MKRITDPQEMKALLDANAPPELIHGDGSAIWLSDERNIALRIGDDLAVFQWFGDGIFEAHTWFASRGRDALANGRAMLAEIHRLGAQVIYGETPLGDKYRGVHWFNRKLGFTPVREVERGHGRRLVYVLNGNSFSPDTMA